MTVSVLWLFVTVPCVGLQCGIVAFPDQTHCFDDVPNMKLTLLIQCLLIAWAHSGSTRGFH